MGVRRWVAGLVVVVAVVAAGCTDDGRSDPGNGTSTTAATLPAQPTDTDLTDAVGCVVTRDFGDDSPAVDPIRGGAATDGVACTLDGDELHLFVRAPLRPEPGFGGSLENIDRLVVTGTSSDCTTWVAVGETWFALAADEDLLADVADDLGGTVREILPTGPPASYMPPGCRRG